MCLNVLYLVVGENSDLLGEVAAEPLTAPSGVSPAAIADAHRLASDELGVIVGVEPA